MDFFEITYIKYVRPLSIFVTTVDASLYVSVSIVQFYIPILEFKF